MEDEGADRVYAPPDRDVEPLWEAEELAAPVHGRPVPHDTPPPLPVPPTGVYRPGDRAPAPPPAQHGQGPVPVQRPNGAIPIPPQPPARPDRTPIPAPAPPPPVFEGGEFDEEESGVHTLPDSPWSQPPQRPAPPPAPTDPARAATGSASVPPQPGPQGGAALPPGPRAATAPAQANATPAPGPHGPSAPAQDSHGPGAPAQGSHGPGAPAQGSHGPGTPAQGSLNAGAPTQGPHSAASAGHGPPVAVPAQRPHGAAPLQEPHVDAQRQRPHAQGQGPHADAQGQRPHADAQEQRPPADARGHEARAVPPSPGPYPPSVDPRAFPQQAYPQVYQPHPQVQPPAHPQAPSQPPGDPFQDLPWVSDGTPTAEEFARRRLAKPPDPIAKVGVRGAVNNITGGLAKLSPGRREIERKQDVEMVRRNFGGLRQVTVVNPKGGAGKTVAVLLLAMTFGQKRGGYVLAWDNNETQGTLGMRAQQDFHARTVRDMMRDLHLFRGAHGRVGDLSQYVRAQGEGMFDVLASDESATAGEMLTADAFAEIREIVSRFYKLIFVDTGNNVRAQNWQAAMDATDQLVITMSARNDSAETAARMLDHLEQSGRQRLVRQAISVVSMPPTRKDIDLPAIQRHFAARTRAVLLAPYEKLIDSGEPLRYGQLSGNTRDAWLKIAAAVAEGL
ncbi:chromosome partitioning protein [Actinoplanes sp. NPDC048796]|uniref:chromosome partitioning protein n=1 Tax=Actinoplanes sp. NPDC048796 TaxID=3155640 RepID=UPI00340A8129